MPGTGLVVETKAHLPRIGWPRDIEDVQAVFRGEGAPGPLGPNVDVANRAGGGGHVHDLLRLALDRQPRAHLDRPAWIAHVDNPHPGGHGRDEGIASIERHAARRSDDRRGQRCRQGYGDRYRADFHRMSRI